MDINKASPEELETAFQVDGTRARYLVDYREKNGPFRSWEEVKRVPSFEDDMVENLQAAGLTLSEPGRERTETPVGPRRRGMDINSASAEELEQVFQIDGQRARYLVEARNRIGGFRSWEDVKREAPSFEDGMIENLKRAGARIGNKAA